MVTMVQRSSLEGGGSGRVSEDFEVLIFTISNRPNPKIRSTCVADRKLSNKNTEGNVVNSKLSLNAPFEAAEMFNISQLSGDPESDR